MIAWIAAASCLLALVPAVLFLRNLALYAPPPLANGRVRARCSVLIPARNEESTIANAVRSVLRNQGADFEVIVLDDDSADQTAQIVRALANDDGRVHLATAPPLPAGWCGKQHACHVLAHLAQHPLLIFMDADVRLKPDALARMSAFMEQSGAALASGVPQQETRTFSERLLIPLIHFVLLGFLPINRMRASRDPVLARAAASFSLRDARRITAAVDTALFALRYTTAQSWRASSVPPASRPTSLTPRASPNAVCTRPTLRCGAALRETRTKV